MKKFAIVFIAILLAGSITACSSPEEKAAEYVENADSLFLEGKLNKAEIEYKNALQINQNLADAWYGLARIHERKQKWKQVYGTLNRIREINPRHVDGRIMLGQVLLASNQIDQALEDANEILELAPNDARAHSLMAAVQFRLGNYEEARASVERALSIDALNNEALLVSARVLIAEKKFDQAIALLDKSIESSPENVSLYLMKIQAYSELGDTKGTEGVFQDLIKKFPDSIAYRQALARSYLQSKDIDSAEKVLEEIVTVAPDNVGEKIRLVAFKRQYRSFEDAIALLENYIAQDKSQYRFRFSLGELYEQIGQPDAAIGIYQEIVADDELSPSGLEARNKLALLNLKDGNLDEATKLVEEVLAHDTKNENALLLQAGLKINDRRFDDAIVDLRTVLRDNPQSLKALALLGQAYDASGSRELAVESYTKAFQINPGEPSVANQLARNLIAQNNSSRANEIIQQSIKSGNTSVGALRVLTDIKLRLGEWDEAERLAQQLKQFEGQEAVSEQVMGVIYLGREQQTESIEAFKRAHELAPESAQPMVALVRTYLRNREYDNARRFLESVLEENRENISALLLLGQLSLLENQTGEAMEHFEKIIGLRPQSVVGYRSLAAVHLSKNRLEEAVKATQRGLQALPQNITLSINLASIYERQKEFDKAIELYESLLEINPDLIIAKNNLASLLTDYRSDQESHDRARKMAAEFKDSDIPQFRDSYAWASVRSGLNLEEAIVILEGIVRENEQVGVYHYHLGEAYRKKGDLENAVASLEKAVSLETPQSEIAEKAQQALKQIN